MRGGGKENGLGQSISNVLSSQSLIQAISLFCIFAAITLLVESFRSLLFNGDHGLM